VTLFSGGVREASLQPRILASAALGVVVGFLIATLLLPTNGASTAILAAAAGFVVGGVATDLAQEFVKRGASLVWSYARGDLRGHRRIEKRLLGKAPILVHSGSQRFEQRWVDPWELDHLGWSYGVAQSPTYVPLYGNGLTDLEITVELVPWQNRLADEAGEELLRSRAAELAENARREGRFFGDGPMAALRRFTPPPAGNHLHLVCEQVGHRRYAAATNLLLHDDGTLRRQYEIQVRNLANPICCGALGVEIALVTSDGFLVLAHRGRLGLDYSDLVMAGVGEGVSPERDRSRDGVLDLARTITRGALEEFGLRVDGAKSHLLALGVEMQRMDPDILGYLEVPYTRTEVVGAVKTGAARDRWENRTLDFIEFKPSSVADFLRYRRDVTPATPLGLVFACLHRFGAEATSKAMTSW
jgi:hypothetical protein